MLLTRDLPGAVPYRTAGVVLSFTLIVAMAASAQECRNIFDPHYPGLQQCTVSLEITTVEADPSESQQRTLWCWAASMSTIYTSLGHAISQKRIVEQVYGAPVNYPSGELPFFNHSLNRTYVDDSGRKFSVSAAAVRTPEDAIKALSSGKPIVFTANHHVIVQTALTYQFAPGGPVVAKGGKVWDPEPNMGWRTLTAFDMSHYEAAWAVSVSGSTTDPDSIVDTPIVPPKIDLCGGIRAGISAARSNFETIKGGRRTGVSEWNTPLVVTGFSECHLIDYVEDNNLTLTCSDPAGSYSETKKSIEACLSNWNEIYNWENMVRFKTDAAKTLVTLNVNKNGALTLKVEK